MTQQDSAKGHDFSRAVGAPQILVGRFSPWIRTLLVPEFSAAKAASFEPPLRHG